MPCPSVKNALLGLFTGRESPWSNYHRAFAGEYGKRLIPDKQPILDIASLLIAVAVGIPQTVVALSAKRPGNLRKLSILLGASGLFFGASAIVHVLGGPAIVRALLLGIGIGMGLGWLLLLLSLARHNTTM